MKSLHLYWCRKRGHPMAVAVILIAIPLTAYVAGIIEERELKRWYNAEMRRIEHESDMEFNRVLNAWVKSKEAA